MSVRARNSTWGAPNSSWSFSTFGAVQVTAHRPPLTLTRTRTRTRTRTLTGAPTVQVTVNRAPFGGDLHATHGELIVALESPIEIEAR